MNSASCSANSRSCSAQRRRMIARRARRLELGAGPRRAIGGDRDAAGATHRVEGERQVVVTRQLDEPRSAVRAMLRHAGEGAARVLDGDEHLRERRDDPRDGGGQDVGHRPRRHVVQDDRQRRVRCQRLEMAKDAFLPRPVVIGRHHQRRVRSRRPGRGHVLRGDAGVVAAGAGDDRHAPPRLVDAGPHDPEMLLEAQRRRLAGGAARDEAGRALGDLPFDEVAIGALVEAAIGRERRDERRDRSVEHGESRPLACPKN